MLVSVTVSVGIVCLPWQTAQTLMRRHVLQRLIWVNAVCIHAFTQVRTLNFRLAGVCDHVHTKPSQSTNMTEAPDWVSFKQRLSTLHFNLG